MLTKAEVAHFDESGARIDGTLHWLLIKPFNRRGKSDGEIMRHNTMKV